MGFYLGMKVPNIIPIPILTPSGLLYIVSFCLLVFCKEIVDTNTKLTIKESV